MIKVSRTQDWFEIRDSPIQGVGAFALRPIPKGTQIIEYTGERITPEEADVRYDDDAVDRPHTFLFTIDKHAVIDGAREGNEARFINHSCAPNCVAYIEGERVLIYARRDIAPGQELVYDYHLERPGPYDPDWQKRYACRCGAPNCRGTMLPPPKRKKKKAKK